MNSDTRYTKDSHPKLPRSNPRQLRGIAVNLEKSKPLSYNRRMATTYQDYGDVLSTPIRAISFNDFFLPETFRLTSIRESRRLNSSVIQRRHGVLQQTTYNGPKDIQIQGQVFTNQFDVNGTPLSCDEIIDTINSRFKTPNDQRLYIQNNRFYYARLTSTQTTYIANTNRNVAELQLSFIASDPHQYSNELLGIGNIHNITGNAFQAHDLPNNGATETPLKITLTLIQAMDSIEIHILDPSTDDLLKAMILDSQPIIGDDGVSVPRQYQDGDTFELNSRTLELNYTTGHTLARITTLAYHHIRDQQPIQNLPINLNPGINRIGVQAQGASNNSNNSIDVTYEYRHRWA